MLAVGPLGKYGDGRSVAERGGRLAPGLGLHFGDILEKVSPRPTSAQGLGPTVQLLEGEGPCSVSPLDRWVRKGGG